MINSNYNLDDELSKKKNNLIYDMRNEIDVLQNNHDHSVLVNSKIALLRTFKIFLYLLKRFYPYLVTASVSFMIMKSLNKAPFINDDIKRNLEIKKQFDSMGNVRYETQYQPYDSDNIIKVYSKWTRDEDGFYTREIKSYYTNRLTIKRIEEIVDDNKITVDMILGEPYVVQTEKKNNITSEELNNEMYVEAVIYSIDEDKYIIVKEKGLEDARAIMLWIFINVFIDIFIKELVNKKRKLETLDELIYKLKIKYPYVNHDELEKIIEIKKDNYKRLVR